MISVSLVKVISRERVHYEAPSAKLVDREMFSMSPLQNEQAGVNFPIGKNCF